MGQRPNSHEPFRCHGSTVVSSCCSGAVLEAKPCVERVCPFSFIVEQSILQISMFYFFVPSVMNASSYIVCSV